MGSLEDQRHIVDIINERKDDAGINNVVLAQRIGLSKGRIGYILRNERKMYASELVALCSYFGIGLEEVMGHKDRLLSYAYGNRSRNSMNPWKSDPRSTAPRGSAYVEGRTNAK